MAIQTQNLSNARPRTPVGIAPATAIKRNLLWMRGALAWVVVLAVCAVAVIATHLSCGCWSKAGIALACLAVFILYIFRFSSDVRHRDHKPLR